MKRVQLLERITELLARFVAQVEHSTSIRQLDINVASEMVVAPMLNLLYGYRLRNLNHEVANYPGIDLADDKRRVSVQVTASSDSGKIKETLEKFMRHKLYLNYDRLIIYILTRKQSSYASERFTDILQGALDFDVARDILDSRDVLKQVDQWEDLERIYQVQEFLEQHFGEWVVPLLRPKLSPRTEQVHLNLLEVAFPRWLYVADLAIDREAVIAASRQPGKEWLPHYSSSRDVARAALHQRGLHFWWDWECHENKIITFHDLDEQAISLREITDLGTVTSLTSEEFYSVDGNYDRVFKSLLRRCLQQQLASYQIHWQHKEMFFFFGPKQEEDKRRVESWRGKREAERTVWERIPSVKDPSVTFCYKHLAFGVQFHLFDGCWYLAIKPDWFFSHDNYHRSYVNREKVSYLKREESNQHVYNHLRFLTYFLCESNKQGQLAQDSYKPILSFKELVSFNNAPYLSDREWNPPKDQGKRRKKPRGNKNGLTQMGLEFDT